MREGNACPYVFCVESVRGGLDHYTAAAAGGGRGGGVGGVWWGGTFLLLSC